MPDPIRIPLRRRDGTIRAYALIDRCDSEQAAHPWHLNNNGYACRKDAQRRKVYLHRVILGLTFGDGLQTDHRNGDKLNNRRSNLRVVTHAENGQNVPSLGGSSKYRGVSWDKRGRRWEAYAHYAGRRHFLGYFTSEQAAAEAASAFRLANMTHTTER